MYCDLVEVVLKNNTFKFGKKILKEKRRTAIGTNFAPPYSIQFVTEVEEELLRKAGFKPHLWWRYIDDIFFFWEHGEVKLKSFIDTINKIHPTIKVTADWSKTSINVLDVTASIAEDIIETDLYVKSTDSHQYSLWCKDGYVFDKSIFYFPMFRVLYYPQCKGTALQVFYVHFKKFHNLHNYNCNKHIK